MEENSKPTKKRIPPPETDLDDSSPIPPEFWFSQAESCTDSEFQRCFDAVPAYYKPPVPESDQMGKMTTPDAEGGWVTVRSEKIRVLHQQPAAPPGSAISTEKEIVEGSHMSISMSMGAEDDQFGVGGSKCDVGPIEIDPVLLDIIGIYCPGVLGLSPPFYVPKMPLVGISAKVDQFVRAADEDKIISPPLEMSIGTDGSESVGGPIAIDPLLLKFIGTYCPAVLRMNPPFYVAKSDNQNDQLAQPSHKKPRCV